MRDRTEPTWPSGHPGQPLDHLDEAVRAIARDARELLTQVRALEAQADTLSRSVLQAAYAIDQARNHGDG
jgi:hypothetical protein